VAHVERLQDALRRHNAALDASDTGTGKTYCAIEVARRMGVRPLVLCPKSVIRSWQRVAEAAGVEADVVNYESARGASKNKRCSSVWGQQKPYGSGSYWEWSVRPRLMIFDEVHRCGGMTTLHSKMLLAAKRQGTPLLLLSATAADDPVRMKALGFALGLFEVANFKWWLMKHGVNPGRWGGFQFSQHYEVREAAMLKLHAQLFPSRAARIRKSEIEGFPQTVIEPRLLNDVSGKARTLSDELHALYARRQAQAGDAERDSEDNRDGDEENRNPASALVQMLRRRQALELLKVPDLAELASDHATTSRVVIFVHYAETLRALQGALRKEFGEVPVIDGTNTAAERQRVQDDFQANRIPVLLCNAEAGGVALSLHDPTGKVERTALISPGWSARQFRQILGRVHRDGGAYSQQLLVGFADTVEERIMATVAERANRLDLLNDGIFHGLNT
jgi:superfamily II DNA or RNA helicase